jgi:hypothetical protein
MLVLAASHPLPPDGTWRRRPRSHRKAQHWWAPSWATESRLVGNEPATLGQYREWGSAINRFGTSETEIQTDFQGTARICDRNGEPVLSDCKSGI